MSTNEAQHTPGPWMVTERNTGERSALLVSKDDCMNFGAIAEVYPWNPGGDPQANAHLIAAAPDLYEALHEILNYIGGADGPLLDSYVMDRAEAALAKARGEAS